MAAKHRSQPPSVFCTMHGSAIFQAPISVVLFCLCDKVYHKEEVRFLLYLRTRSDCHLTI